MNKLWKFEVDFRRMGELEGLFIATAEEIEALEGKNVYFGEVLGKHSDIDVDFTRNMVTCLEVGEEAIAALSEHVGMTISGYNPLEYFADQAE